MMWARQQRTGNASSKSLLLFLGELSDDSGYVFRGQEFIASILECSRSTVMRNLQALESAGFIVREVRFWDDSHKRRTDAIALTFKGCESHASDCSMDPESHASDCMEPCVNLHESHASICSTKITKTLLNNKQNKYTATASPIAAESRPRAPGKSVQPPLGEVCITERHEVDMPKQNAATLIGEWIDHCAEKPPARVIGQMSREIKNLLVEGIGYERVRSALAELHRKGANPATLASFVYSQSAVIEMPQAIPNRATIRESTESTTTQRMRQTAVLVEQLRAQGR